MQVSSRVIIDQARIQQLTELAITALEQTAEALHTEVVQAQVMPRDTGHLQNESTFCGYKQTCSRCSISCFKHTLRTQTVFSPRIQLPP